MTKEEEIKMKMLEFEVALQKAYRTLDQIKFLGEQARLIRTLYEPYEPIEIRPWWLF